MPSGGTRKRFRDREGPHEALGCPTRLRDSMTGRAHAVRPRQFIVLHVAQPTVDGVARVVASLVEEQLSRGWVVVVACPSGGGPLSADVTKMGARHLEWEAARNPSRSVLREAATLSRLVRQVHPDVVHLHSSKAGLVGRLVVRRRCATVFQPHGWSFHAVSDPLRSLVVRWEVFATRWTDLLICVSGEEMSEGTRLGVAARYEICPNGVDTVRFAPLSTEDGDGARDRLGLSSPTVVCIGRICMQKGQDVLLRAWERVLHEVPEANLVLVGNVNSPSVLPAQLPARVQLVGRKDDVAPWLAAADVVVVPSRWDGQSVVILEAMASGKSIVATSVAGARESLGEAGAIVGTDDPLALADALVARLQDDGLRKREGEDARRRVESRFVISSSARRIGDLYSSLSIQPVGDSAPRGEQASLSGAQQNGPKQRSEALSTRSAEAAPDAGSEHSPSVCAIVVTYGSRALLCIRAAESALEAGASSLVIVDNGSDEIACSQVAEWARHRANVTIVSLDRNTGSAQGFGKGIEAGLDDGAEYIWLLDDDSDVEADALAELAREANRRREAGDARFALVSLRPDSTAAALAGKWDAGGARLPVKRLVFELQHSRPSPEIRPQCTP